jgi:ABC-2 type transport system ATP-binding protein
MIKVEDIIFEYEQTRVLHQINFDFEEGEIVALVGPNGSGKTTLMRTICGFLTPLSGNIWVNGVDVVENPRDAHSQLGYLSDFFGLYDDLTVYQSLQFTAYSRIQNQIDIPTRIDQVIEQLNITDFAYKKVGALSRGMRQRVGIAQAIVHQPKVLLLDEPASGLDPEARYDLSKLLLKLRDEGMTMMVSSHILAELEDYSSSMLVLKSGRIVEQRKLTANQEDWLSMFIKSSQNEEIAAFFYQYEHVKDWRSENGKLIFKLNSEVVSKSELLKLLINSSFEIDEISEQKLDLQEEYIKSLNR